MSKNRQKVVIAVGVLAAIIVGLGPLVGPPLLTVLQVNRAQIRLLCTTDHRALLEACRKLSQQSLNTEFKGELYAAAEIRQLPEPIPALRPNHVTVGRNGLVKIEMHSNGWYYLGIHAYPEGYPEHPPPFRYGDRKLLEGLWYYDKGYKMTDPEAYDRRIDELLSENPNLGEKTIEPSRDSDWPGA